MNTYEAMSVIASVTSGVAAVATGYVSWRIFQLQKTVEDAKKPLVHIWYNGTKKLLPKLSAELSFANLGSTALLVRKIRLLGNDGQAMPIALIRAEQLPQHRDRSYTQTSPKHEQEIVNVVFGPSEIAGLSFEIEAGQMKVEVMYYDNSFEFVEIDTSNLGGKYTLTGKGKKYG